MNRKLWNGIWVTELLSADGAVALVADRGAHIVSWIPAGGEETLFLSPDARFGGDEAIRGGVPIIFPQFNQRGHGMRHGFARLAEWMPVLSAQIEGRAIARYKLTEAGATQFNWSQPFTAIYEVSLSAQQLSMSLTISNPSEQTWEFTAALHTYLRVSDIAHVRLSGLQGVSYTNFMPGGDSGVQQQEFLTQLESVDYIFAGTTQPLGMQDGERLITSSQLGFTDAVVWNPGLEISKQMSDLAAQSYRSFLCVEAAAVEQPVVLAPHQSWTGVQQLTLTS